MACHCFFQFGETFRAASTPPTHCELYNAVSKRLCDGFPRHLSAICSSNATKWVKVRLLPSKPGLFSSHISFNSSFIKLYQLQIASTGRISWAKMLNITNLKLLLHVSCRGAIDNSLPLHVKGLGFNSRRWKLFLPFLGRLVLFFFLKHNCLFWQT